MKYNMTYDTREGVFVLRVEQWIHGEWVNDVVTDPDPAMMFGAFGETGLHHMRISDQAAEELAKRLAPEKAKEPEPYEDYL